MLVAVFIFQPQRLADAWTGQHKLPPIPWRQIAAPCLVTLFGRILFYAPIVELSFLLDGIGVTSVATIGLVSASPRLPPRSERSRSAASRAAAPPCCY